MVLVSEISVINLMGSAMLLFGGVILVISARYVWRTTAIYRASEITSLDGTDAGTLVRATGTLHRSHEDSLVSPFSGVECAVLQYSIEERRLSFPYVFPWYVMVHEAMGSNAFDVRTNNGIVPVTPSVNTVALSNHEVAKVGVTDDPSDRIAQFEREIDRVPTTTMWRKPPSVIAPLFRLLSIGTRRYCEQRASHGEDVTVVGRTSDDGFEIDPIVVSDGSSSATVFRMAKTSLIGLLLGLIALVGGYLLLIAG